MMLSLSAKIGSSMERPLAFWKAMRSRLLLGRTEPEASPEKRSVLRRNLSVGLGIVWSSPRDRSAVPAACRTVRRGLQLAETDARAISRMLSREMPISASWRSLSALKLFVGSEILSVVGEALAQAGENARLLDIVGVGVQIDGVSHGRFPLGWFG